MIPIALTVAGSDPSGGAGLQADLKTFHQHGVYGAAVVTLLTVQNSREVREVRHLDHDFVLAQLDAVLDDLPPAAAKTGALGRAEAIEALGWKAKGFSFPLVVDPVLVSQHGAALADGDGAEAYRKHLLPHAFLATPNRMEATRLSGCDVHDRRTMREAARAIADLGARAVLVKGGHLESEEATDLLYFDKEFREYTARRIETRHTHGTGCAYPAAIAARPARQFRP